MTAVEQLRAVQAELRRQRAACTPKHASNPAYQRYTVGISALNWIIAGLQAEAEGAGR